MTGLLAAPQITCTYWLDPWLLLEGAPLWPEGQHTTARTELCRAGRVLGVIRLLRDNNPLPLGGNNPQYLFILLETSRSFMKHSMLSGRSDAFALISFLSFSHS